MSSTLDQYGWNPFFERGLAEDGGDGADVGRVILGERGVMHVLTVGGTVEATVAGRLRYRAASDGEPYPVVGDWVVLGRSAGGPRARVEAILPRRSALSRKASGNRATEQVVAANVDVVLVVMGLDDDFNLRRLERFLVMVLGSGARPVVALNKADLCPDAASRREAAQSVAPGVPVIVLSALEGLVEGLAEHLTERETIALVGSSGVGKSTLVNRLAGSDLMATGPVRSGDDRGRHTTTRRELVRLPGGALLIDNPGVRELQPWDAEDGLDDAFADVHELAANCRFRDCTHGDEPGCEVRRAVADGQLDGARLANLQTLEEQHRALEQRRDAQAKRQQEKSQGRLYKSIMADKKARRRGWR